jgi:hypothetical protein
MLAYISYASVSTQDPHSDYAVQMQSVCQARHIEFEKAVDKFSPSDKSWFVSRIFNPDRCNALAYPEAE